MAVSAVRRKVIVLVVRAKVGLEAKVHIIIIIRNELRRHALFLSSHSGVFKSSLEGSLFSGSSVFNEPADHLVGVGVVVGTT